MIKVLMKSLTYLDLLMNQPGQQLVTENTVFLNSHSSVKTSEINERNPQELLQDVKE